MKYIILSILILVSITSTAQCKKDTKVQYYNSNYQTYSKNYNVTVSFGTGSEISNNYNYIGYESDALYCVIYGFKKKHEVKLFTNYNSIYKTTCSSINSIFSGNFIKGKDQDGRIWKIRKPSSEYYSDNSYRSPRKYNKPTSNINHKYIASTLNSMQAKIDYNREILSKLIDNLNRRRDLLHYRIKKLNNPMELKKMYQTINSNVENCARNIDTGSNRATSSVVSCMNRQFTQLDILENEINNYSITGSSKSFYVVSISKKDVSYSDVKSITNKEGKTFVEIEYISPYQIDGWIAIAKETYLYDGTNNLNLKLMSVRNITVSPKRKYVPYNTKIIFELIFEQLPENSKKVSIIECESKSDGCFNFYGVTIY